MVRSTPSVSKRALMEGSARPWGGSSAGTQTSFPAPMRGLSSMVALMGWMSGSSPGSV